MTTNDGEYRSLLHRILVAAASCILAVVIYYFWVDRSVAFFVYRHHINSIEAFRWLTSASRSAELVGADADNADCAPRFGDRSCDGRGCCLWPALA